MKIINIYNILLAKSLKGFLPFQQNITPMSMERFPTPMGFGWDFQMTRMYVWQLSLLIFGAAGMCNGREFSGR